MSEVKPVIRALSRDQCEQVHQYSLRILSSVGVRIDSENAQSLVARTTGQSAGADGRVRLPADLVDWALQVAPSSVAVYDRRGVRQFCLGSDRPRFGIGVTALYYQDPRTDDVTPFARCHMELMVRLADALPNYDAISTVGVIQDTPPEQSDLYAVLEMLANGTKPLVVLVSDDERFGDVLDLAQALHGDLSGRPFLIPYLNPITPLVINRGTADKMQVCVQREIPFIYSNYGMAGASTPLSPAGTLALMNAELLAGLTLSQMLRPGAPIVLGNLPAYFDMRGMGNLYDPVSYLLNLACAEMMAHYQLPHAGTSGSGMGWGADLIAAGHQWFNHLTTCLGPVGLAPFVGDTLGSKVFSPSVVVLADEIIAQARRLADGFALDWSRVGLQEILTVGPGGSFLTCPSTLQQMRTAAFQSALFPNLTLESWQTAGKPSAETRLRQRTVELLENLVAPPDHRALMEAGSRWIADHCAR